jgi:hypothetical protein
MAKQVIPEVRSTDAYDFLFKKAVKDNLDQLTGVVGGRIAPLPVTASLADVIAKVNEIVARLNFK